MGISWVARKPIFCEKLWNSPKSAKIPRPHPMKKVKKNEKFSKNFFLLQIERNEEKMNFKQKKIFFFKILTFWYFSKGVPFEKWAKSAKISKNKKNCFCSTPKENLCVHLWFFFRKQFFGLNFISSELGERSGLHTQACCEQNRKIWPPLEDHWKSIGKWKKFKKKQKKCLFKAAGPKLIDASLIFWQKTILWT